jgi:hypothetical protein
LLVEIIHKFLGLIFGIGETEFELAFLGAQDDGLAFHATDHIEGSAGLAAQGQFQEIFLDASLKGFLQIALDLEEAVGGADAADALVRAAVVVIGDPEFDTLAGGFETLELGAGEELAPDGSPETFDLAQGHGVMGPAFDVADAVFLELGFEAADAAPGGVLAAVVGEHFLGRLIFADGHPVNFNDRRGGGAAEQVRPDDVPGIVIEEGDQVGVTAAEPEGEDVRLPHLVGGGPLEETGAGEVLGPSWLGRWHQALAVQSGAHRLGTGRQQKQPAQELGDAFGSEGGVRSLQFNNPFGNRRRELVLSGCGSRARLPQRRLPFGAILSNPRHQRAAAYPDLLADQVAAKTVFQNQADGLKLLLR